jgi:hypothetical protein
MNRPSFYKGGLNSKVNALFRSCVVNKTSSEKEVVANPTTQSSLDVEVRMGFCNNLSSLFINAGLNTAENIVDANSVDMQQIISPPPPPLPLPRKFFRKHYSATCHSSYSGFLQENPEI